MRNAIRRILDRLRPNRPTIHAQTITGYACNHCDWHNIGPARIARTMMIDHLAARHGIDIEQIHRHRCESRRLTAMAIAAHQRGANETSALYRERAQWHADAANQLDTQTGDDRG